jgi:uncharacterized protein (DUF433 family)
MSTTINHIELRENRSGERRAYIAGTRTRVQDIYALAEIQGRTPDEIVTALPHLSLGQVHAALSYYFDHRDQILSEVHEDGELIRTIRAATGAGPLESKLNPQDANGDSVPSG